METALVTADMFNRFLEEFKEFKTDVYRRFDHLEKRMDRIETRMYGMKTQQMEDHKILMELYDARNKVRISFSAAFALINVLISVFFATVTSLFVKS